MYGDYYLAGYGQDPTEVSPEELAEVEEAASRAAPLMEMGKGYVSAGQAYMKAAWPVVLIGGLILAYSVSPRKRR